MSEPCRDAAGIKREVEQLEKLLLSRIEGIERAITVAHEDLVRVPTQVDTAVAALKDLTWQRFDTHEQKFRNVDHVFSERDSARQERAVAFSASIDKSDKGLTKNIDSLQALLYATTSSLDAKINDLKDRITQTEARGAGRSDLYGWIVATVVAIAAVLSLMIFHKAPN